MSLARFTGSFTQQPTIPKGGIAAASAVMRSGRHHRYNIVVGDESETIALGRDRAAWQCAHSCVAVTSGTQAKQISLRAYGVRRDDAILTNGLFFAPAQRVIAAVGVDLKWLGVSEPVGFAFDQQSWRYTSSQSPPKADAVPSDLFNRCLPLTFSLEDCALPADHIIDKVTMLASGADS
ncbi:MAG: DegT/DnrJ/EryC1/StrS family aminotransferase [Cypionkella sp.]